MNHRHKPSVRHFNYRLQQVADATGASCAIPATPQRLHVCRPVCVAFGLDRSMASRARGNLSCHAEAPGEIVAPTANGQRRINPLWRLVFVVAHASFKERACSAVLPSPDGP